MSTITVTEKQKKIGAHVLSEWLDDAAPVNERRYLDPAEACFKAMLAAEVEDADIPALTDFRAVFTRAAEALRIVCGKTDPDARVLQKLADAILPGVTR
jgi:hypothetical protein